MNDEEFLFDLFLVHAGKMPGAKGRFLPHHPPELLNLHRNAP